MASDEAVDFRPRTTGEILDDAWRLALADAPFLLLLSGLFQVPTFAVLLLLWTRPAPHGLLQLVLPALAALLVGLTGLGSGACQELFRRRAEHRLVTLAGCLAAALRRGLEHVAARVALLAGIVLGLLLLVMPGLTIWVGGCSVHAVLAGGQGRFLDAWKEIGREARVTPGRAAIVTLSRIPLLLLAVLNLHLIGASLLWAASNLAGFETALLGAELSLENPPYLLALVLLCWLLLTPFAEAANFLLHVDVRTRQEGLDLMYRVQRVFAALDRFNPPAAASGPQRARGTAGVGVLLALGASLLVGVGPLHADAERLETVRAVRAGVERIREEVKAARPYKGGQAWEGRLQGLARQLEGAAEGETRRSRWFRQAIQGFAGRKQEDALRVLAGLQRRLALLEQTLAGRQDERGTEGGRPRLTREQVEKALRRQGPERKSDSQRTEEQSKREESRRQEVRSDDQEPGAHKGRPRTGVVAPQPAGGFGNTGWFLLGGLVLALLVVGLVLFFTRQPARSPAQRQETGRAPGEPESPAPAPHEQPAAVLWQRAEELAQAGNFLEAVRHLYLAVLSLLHRQRLLRYEPTRTNGEYVQQVRLAPEAPPELHVPFERLTNLFEIKWYGERDCPAGDYEKCRALAEEIRDQVSQG